MPKKKMKTIFHLIGNDTANAAASEYIKPGGKINITSHGLGSGIYGFSVPYYENKKEKLPPYFSNGKKLVVKINKPYVVTSDIHCGKLIKWSTAINDVLQKFKDKFLSGRISFKLISNICATQFNLFSKRKITAKKIRTAFRKFFKDYSTRRDYVCMPINYLLKEMRYDGIYVGGTSCDSMSKGNVKFMCPYEKAKTIPVNKIKVRIGTKYTIITVPNFMYVKDKFLRHPPKLTPEYEAWKKKYGILSYVPRKKSRKVKK
jgi:hypothetical protein